MMKKILVVDDDINTVKMISLWLSVNNYKVTAAYDAIQAIEKAHKEKPDLIILDIKMPAGTGVSVYGNLKKSADTAIIPVIFISAYPDKDIKKKVFEMGAKGFISKPFRADVILAKVKEALESHEEDIIGGNTGYWIENIGKKKEPLVPKKILVVDDEPNIVKMVESRLKANGYEVIVAYDGEEAVEKVKSDMPDVIVLDLMLPKIDGYMVYEILKQDEKYKNIPIVMLTARAGYEDIIKGMKMGTIAYITKPFKPETLLGIIAGLVKGNKVEVESF